MSGHRDPDPDLIGDEKTHVLEIAVRRNGSMSVAGSINDLKYALAMLDSARDAILAHHKRQTAVNPSNLILPAHDNALAN